MPLAVFLPLLEMIFGLGLLLDIKGSLAGITGLLMLFTVILSYGIRLGLDVDCGCFGPQDLESRAYHSPGPARESPPGRPPPEAPWWTAPSR